MAQLLTGARGRPGRLLAPFREAGDRGVQLQMLSCRHQWLRLELRRENFEDPVHQFGALFNLRFDCGMRHVEILTPAARRVGVSSQHRFGFDEPQQILHRGGAPPAAQLTHA
jgi:hypothetical protein